MRSGITMLLVTLALSLAACGSGPAGPQVSAEDAWARPAPLAGGNTGIFMRLVNSGDEADRLLGGQSSVAGAVEIHKTVMSGDVMKMEPVQSLEIPSRDEVQLKPGGLHIMLIEVNQPLAPGDTVPITLHFEKSGEMELQVEVREP